MKVLVAGATGSLGSEICRRLAAAGHAVRALVRKTSNPDVVSKLRDGGAAIVVGDLKEASSLDEACREIDAVVSTANSVMSRQDGDSFETVDLAGQKNLIDAAKKAKVQHFVFVSVTMGNLTLDFPFKSAKLGAEQHLKQSGLDYTILRPTFFIEVWLAPPVGIDFVNAKATIFGSGDNPVSYISIGDVAAFAVLALDGQKSFRRTLKLGGPEALAPTDVVKRFERRAGRPYEVQHVPEQALRAQFDAATDPLAQSFAALGLLYAGGDSIDMRATLEEFPVRLTSVDEYINRALAAG